MYCQYLRFPSPMKLWPLLFECSANYYDTLLINPTLCFLFLCGHGIQRLQANLIRYSDEFFALTDKLCIFRVKYLRPHVSLSKNEAHKIYQTSCTARYQTLTSSYLIQVLLNSRSTKDKWKEIVHARNLLNLLVDKKESLSQTCVPREEYTSKQNI